MIEKAFRCVVKSEAVRKSVYWLKNTVPWRNLEQSEALKPVPDSGYLYNFGLSQDDPVTELQALDLKPDDRLLCISSAGELPLGILASEPLLIDAVDISAGQLHLSKLKMAAILALDPEEAAQFLGYISCDRDQRLRLFNRVEEYLDESGRSFWDDHLFVFKKGPIHYGRYELYMSKFRSFGLYLLGGRKKLYGLFECENREAQEEYFDKVLRSGLLERLFKIVFHPKLYKQRGIPEQGFIHEGKRDIAQFFFAQFRSFCTCTPARENYFLQLSFLGSVSYYEALPNFLQDKGVSLIRLHHNNIRYRHISYADILRQSPEGTYNKFALSNVGDWLEREAFTDLLQLIADKADVHSKALLRYIHYAHPVPSGMDQIVISNPAQGEKLRQKDRFPFYNLVPMDIRIREEVFHDR